MLVCVQQAGIPKAMRHIVMKLAELGWLYNKIRTYVESRSADKAFGLIGQVRPTLEQVENCHHFFSFFHFSDVSSSPVSLCFSNNLNLLGGF